MKYTTLCGGVFTLLLSFAVAPGPGTCEGEADPDAYVASSLMSGSIFVVEKWRVDSLTNDRGLPEFCYCPADGSCWAVAPHSICNPTSSERLDPCPVGD